MADLFEDHPTIDAERSKLWPIIRDTPWLDWQLLTKRPERIAGNLPDDWGSGYSNVWLGTSVELQQYAESRLPHLLKVPAAVHFASCEPLLGSLDLQPWLGRDKLDWIIIGGESGPKARPCKPAWIKSLIDQARSAKVPVFLKQLGGKKNKRAGEEAQLDGHCYTEMPANSPVNRQGSAGAA